MARVLDEDELIEHWTLVSDKLDLLAGRIGPSKLGLALWLRFYIAEGRFPSGRSELPDEAVAWVARQVKVSASDIGLVDARPGHRPAVPAAEPQRWQLRLSRWPCWRGLVLRSGAAG